MTVWDRLAMREPGHEPAIEGDDSPIERLIEREVLLDSQEISAKQKMLFLTHELEVAASEPTPLCKRDEAEQISRFAQMAADLELAKARFQEVTKKAATVREEVNRLRQEETLKLNVQVAKQQYAETLRQHQECRSILDKQRKAQQELNVSIQFGAQRDSFLLGELYQKKLILKQLGVEV